MSQAAEATALTVELIVDGSEPASPVISPDGRWVAWTIFVPRGREPRVRELWLAPIGGNSGKLGVTVAEVSATFAIPVMFNQAPVLITPGSAGNWWNGPVSQPPKPARLRVLCHQRARTAAAPAAMAVSSARGPTAVATDPSPPLLA